MSVEGSVIVERQDANTLAYSQNVTAKMLLSGVIPSPDWAEPLVKTLESCTHRPGVRDWIDDRVEEQAPYAFGSTDTTIATGSKPQRFSFLGKKKKDGEFPPRHWGTPTNTGSYFANGPDDHGPTQWGDIDGTPPRRSGFDEEFESGSSSVKQITHRPSHSVEASTSISHPVDSYDPESPFNSLPPFRSVHSTLSDKTVSHSRSMSAPKLGYSTGQRDHLSNYTNPFSTTPPLEDDLEYYRDTVKHSPRFKTKLELSEPLSPHEGVARAIALYEFKAIQVWSDSIYQVSSP